MMSTKINPSEIHQVSRNILTKNNFRDILFKKWGDRYRLYRENWRLASQGELVSDFPLHIDIDTIDACNLSCFHCQEENTRTRTGKRMQIDIIDKMFEEADGYDGPCALNIGAVGEPLLFKDLVYNILEKAQKYHVMETFIHTNGLLLDENTSTNIINLEPTYLCVSVDAADDEGYKKSRGGDFKLLEHYLKEFINIREKAKKIFPVLRLSFLDEEFSEDFKKKVFIKWQEVADIIDFQPLINYRKPVNNEVIKPCFSPWMRFMIGVQGEMGVCCNGIAFNEDIILGHYPTTIYEVWHGKRINELRQAMVNKNLTDFFTCKDCLSRRSIKT